jgi:hypothetical protein
MEKLYPYADTVGKWLCDIHGNSVNTSFTLLVKYLVVYMDVIFGMHCHIWLGPLWRPALS